MATVKCVWVLYTLHVFLLLLPIFVHFSHKSVFKHVHACPFSLSVCMFFAHDLRKWCKLSHLVSFLLLLFFIHFQLVSSHLCPILGHHNPQFGYGWSCNIGSFSNNITNLLRWYWGACNCRIDCWIWTKIGDIYRKTYGNESGSISCLFALCEVSENFLISLIRLGSATKDFYIFLIQ